MEETMHEFQYMQFNKMVKGKNGQLCKQWRRMFSKIRITDNSDSLFLFYPQFIKTCSVCTAVVRQVSNLHSGRCTCQI
jgi:hypothetical protein